MERLKLEPNHFHECQKILQNAKENPKYHREKIQKFDKMKE